MPELLINLVMNRFVFIAFLRVENILQSHRPFVMIFANVQQEMKVQRFMAIKQESQSFILIRVGRKDNSATSHFLKLLSIAAYKFFTEIKGEKGQIRTKPTIIYFG